MNTTKVGKRYIKRDGDRVLICVRGEWIELRLQDIERAQVWTPAKQQSTERQLEVDLGNVTSNRGSNE